jgi:glyoxylase-like metal-dependent hydrolase (beta-lactamase superfamily II)
MRVIPIPVRKDNYSYLIVDDTANEAAAVDPYTPSKVKETADQLGVRVVAGLTTHHHHDHSGGNQVCSVPFLLFLISDAVETRGFFVWFLFFGLAPSKLN